MTSILRQNVDFDLLKQDPELQIKLLNKYVKVTMIHNFFRKGFVHSFDPVSHSIILLIPDGEKYNTSIIPGHAILEITKLKLHEGMEPPQRTISLVYSNEELLDRKNNLIAWFKSNLLTVTELDDRIMIGNIFVLPPYQSLDVCTDNPIVALQIKKVLESMPIDFSSNSN